MQEHYYELVNKYFKNKEVKDLFYKQIDFFFNTKDIKRKTYKIGDSVKLDKNYLIHGTGIEIDQLNKIKETGLLAIEFLGKENRYQKKPYTCEFWQIKKKTLLGDYIKKYTGGTIVYEKRNKVEEEVVPFDEIETSIKKQDFKFIKWTVYQTKEGRFLPTNNSIKLAFILNGNNSKKMLENSIQSNKLDEKIKKYILPESFYEKYVKDGFHNYDQYETKREIAILFGLPSNLIEGICVNKKIEKSKKDLNKIKSIFPNCYICNIDGKVIEK